MRKPRFAIIESNSVFHCISRIVAGEFLLAPDPIRRTLRGMLRRHAAFCGVRIITYTLMSNHFHILVRIPVQPPLSDREILGRVSAFYGKNAPETLLLEDSIKTTGSIGETDRIRLLKRMNNLSVFMKELKQSFSIWYNRTHQRFGTLWAERFRSILVEDRPEVVRTVAAYIDLNPVRAGLVRDPADYPFCGYGEAAAGNALAISGIASFEADGNDDWHHVAEKYRETLFSKADIGAADAGQLTPERAREIWERRGELSRPDALRLGIRYLIDGDALGSQAFVEEMFLRYRPYFGPKRKNGARPLRGLPFKELRTMRDLRVSVIV